MASVEGRTKGWNPWHEGERILQCRLGIDEQMTLVGSKVIRDYMPDQHREFFAQLPFIVVGMVDENGDPWASLVCGQPGFINSPDNRRLDLEVAKDSEDPAFNGFANGRAIGLLGIELATRRRNRMNGRVCDATASGFSVEVDHSFGNCPQYIQQRDWRFDRNPADRSGVPVEILDPADNRIRPFVEAADTFFVASYAEPDGERQVDVSHRGGQCGFVRIDDDGLLTIPDFSGNLHFNTLGNFLVNPRAGLVFADFEAGDLLHLTGDAEVILESPEIEAFEGAERLWTFRPRRAVLRRDALPIRFRMRTDGWSPNTLMTGDWTRARQRIDAKHAAKRWRRFRISKTVDESRSIRSFYLEPTDGGGLAPFRAGQHLPVRVSIPGQERPVVRTYSLSVAPADGFYRITVKREASGLVSRQLHDRLGEGDEIEVRVPVGGFTIDAAERRPAVLLAAGIGITPLLAMLRHLIHEGRRTRSTRPSWLFQAAHSRNERAFDNELEKLAEEAGELCRIVRLAEEIEVGEFPGTHPGRLTADLLRQTLPLDDYDFYLCGPPGFMQHVYDTLQSLGVDDARIHAETFGPASLIRSTDAGPNAQSGAIASDVPVDVTFCASGRNTLWTPDSGSLLELAEASGLAPDHSCRRGSCGTCAVRLKSGRVAYVRQPVAAPSPDEVLICCAVPANSKGNDDDPLVIDL